MELQMSLWLKLIGERKKRTVKTEHMIANGHAKRAKKEEELINIATNCKTFQGTISCSQCLSLAGYTVCTHKSRNFTPQMIFQA
jgi:hypothetical protein